MVGREQENGAGQAGSLLQGLLGRMNGMDPPSPNGMAVGAFPFLVEYPFSPMGAEQTGCVGRELLAGLLDRPGGETICVQ